MSNKCRLILCNYCRDSTNAKIDAEKRQRDEDVTADQSTIETPKKPLDEYIESANTKSVNGVR